MFPLLWIISALAAIVAGGFLIAPGVGLIALGACMLLMVRR